MRSREAYTSAMAYGVAVLVGALFGAGVEHLGSLAFGPWGWATSRLSAPWLLLPFLFGLTQQRARPAAFVGVLATFCAVCGYVLMLIASAGVDSGGVTAAIALRETMTQLRWFIAGAASGPVYGWLGYRWRTTRWWPSALGAAGALALEPALLLLTGAAFGPGLVYVVESATGVAWAALFVWIARHSAVETATAASA